MTYIDYLNAFNTWTESNRLPGSAKLMYYGLLHIFNKARWPDEVQVDFQRMMILLDTTSKATAVRARDCLAREGIIRYEKGRKGEPNRYRLCNLNETLNGTANETENRTLNETSNETANETHNKNKNKNKTKTDTPPLSPKGSARETYGMDDEGFALFWQAYPKKQGKIHARKAWDKLVPLARQDILLRQHILDSLERWNRSDEWSRDDGRYIPLPASWLNGRRWEDEVMIKKTVKEQIDELYNHPDEYWTAGGVVPDCEDPWN